MKANYKIIEDTEERILLDDLGPWDKHKTITNDAEAIVEKFVLEGLGQRSLQYYNSSNILTELLIENRMFVGYKEFGEGC